MCNEVLVQNRTLLHLCNNCTHLSAIQYSPRHYHLLTRPTIAPVRTKLTSENWLERNKKGNKSKSGRLYDFRAALKNPLACTKAIHKTCFVCLNSSAILYLRSLSVWPPFAQMNLTNTCTNLHVRFTRVLCVKF